MLPWLRRKWSLTHVRNFVEAPLDISIRAQLTALVCVVALLSLIVLAVITGVYFSSNFKSLRGERLYVAAQLKASQIDQTLKSLYYQCYWLATRGTLQNALTQYLAGNVTEEDFSDSSTVVDKFLGSSDLFSAAKLYDSSFKEVLFSTNNNSGNAIPPDVLEQLFPLSTNDSLPSSLESSGMLTDPVLNGSVYLMSMSLPILANPSIILSDSRIYGYLTVVMSAEGLKAVFNDTTALDKSYVTIISTSYREGKLAGFHLVFPPYGTQTYVTSYVFPMTNGSFTEDALLEGKGGTLDNTEFLGRRVAMGYSRCTFSFVAWVAIVSQPANVFLSPSTKLTKIIAGTVIGIAAVVCLATFPLAHWAVQPIVRLQKATEIITAGRGLRSDNNSASISRSDSSHKRSSTVGSFGSAFRLRNDKLLANSYVERTAGNGSPEKGDASAGETKLDRSNHLVGNSARNSFHSETASERSDRYMIPTSLMIDARVPVYRRFFSDELSELTDTFNTMADELDRYYTLLEDRVRARTKQLEAAKVEAEAANEAKTVFIANISHELRTPLNGILGMTAIAMAEDDPQKLKNSLKLIFRSGELLLHILTELLTFSKNVLKRTKLEERNFSILDVALQVKSIFGKLAKDQHVKLSITIEPNMLRSMGLWGDSNRIIQIMMNLVSNALKFTPVDGEVNVRFKLLGEYDKERSEKSNRCEVCLGDGTTPHDMIESEPFPTIEQKEGNADGKQEERVGSSDHSSSSESAQSSPQELAKKANFSDGSSDEKSIQESLDSSTTSSYDNAIFYSQFRKSFSDDDNGDSNEDSKLEHPKTWVITMEVEDTGPGIDTSLQESVFEPFVQGDQTLSRQYGGTGLGLSICRQLAAMMKGTMELESTVGVGSKFTFTLPLTQVREISFDDVEAPFEDEFNPHSKKNRKVKFKVSKASKKPRLRSTANESESSCENNNISGSDLSMGSVRVDRPFLQSTGTAQSSRNVTTLQTSRNEGKILVAEDNNVNQEVIKRMLNLEGLARIDLACDGEEAFLKVKEQVEENDFYDMIFMDVQMPKVDGLTATKQIRQELKYDHPIVALTAYADDSNIKECLNAGMNGFLSKPIKRPKLRNILREFSPSTLEAAKKNP
ncbi:LAMI_0H00914g1_1 [Lachancea mirantina]|uniref:histidine kinase n=1 Tax=Lachancea mirantina TaxID=1230905 RepID=A0A1G4KDJ4_9SACH|nr:LAMI_0H00914g1_1 [Lachancea mirantina]